VVGVGVVICLERGADFHIAQLMPLPLTVSGFSKIQIGFTFLLPAHPGSLGKESLNGCVYVSVNTGWPTLCELELVARHVSPLIFVQHELFTSNCTSHVRILS